MKKISKYIFYFITPLIVGFISSTLTSNYRNFYKTLIKPPLAPPGYLFGIVWTILFILIGTSYFLLKYKTEGIDISDADFFYYLQLIINFFWSIFFFKNQALTFSFIWLVFLLVVVIITFLKFYRINKTSGYLLIPYILWIIFAGYLNLSIAILN